MTTHISNPCIITIPFTPRVRRYPISSTDAWASTISEKPKIPPLFKPHWIRESHIAKTLVHISLYFVGLKFQSNYPTCIQVCLRYEAKININIQIRYSYIPYRVVYNLFSPRIKKSNYLSFLTEKYLYNTWSYILKELWTVGRQCYIVKEHHLKHC